MTRDTPWGAGRFDAKVGPRRILFGRMYEDAAIEQAAFPAGGHVLCIASAGCTAMALAPRHRVTAVDINPVQLAYAERRVAGGAAQIGSAERLVGFGRRLMAPFGWRRPTLEVFLELEDPAEQITFWNRRLNTVGFRLATDLLFSLAWLRLVYAAPFLQILPPRFGQVMRARLERCWKTHPNRTNAYAQALLLGQPHKPPSLPARHPIRLVCTDAASFLESCPPASFDAFTLSNILDGAPDSYRDRLLTAVRRTGSPESLVILRSFAEPRSDSSTNLAARDRSMLWGVVDVRRVHSL